MNWEPQANVLQELQHLLNGVGNANNAHHREVLERLQQMNAMPDINNYLMYLFMNMPNELDTVRATAGLVLKNNVRAGYMQMNPQVKEYIKQNCLRGIADPSPLVRSTIGSVITTILTAGQDWPQLVPALVNLLSNPPDVVVIESALSALAKICDDTASMMDYGTAQMLVPVFLRFFEHPEAKVRELAITATNQFISTRVQGGQPAVHPALLQHIDTFIQGLYNRATDPSPDVRRLVCQGLVYLLEMESDKLMPQMPAIIEFMLHSTSDADERVALEVCDFWMAIAEVPEAYPLVEAVLPRLVPILIGGMIYQDDDIALLRADEEDFAEPDRREDIKPNFYHVRTHVAGSTDMTADVAVDVDDGDDEDDEDGGIDDEGMGEWNFRKSSAASIDQLSSVFGEGLLPHVLPLVEPLLQSQEWKQRECGILVIGAIAEGCAQALEPHLPQLSTYLLRMMQDEKPLVRSIACWTVSRFSSWYVRHQTDDYLRPILWLLLKGMLDRKKRVQEAACSALGTLEEQAQERLVPYLEPMLQHITQAFGMYKHKNLLILYDTLSTLATSVGSVLNTPQYVSLIMQPLQDKWLALGDNDDNLFPLLECMATVATVLGLGFLPYAPAVFDRCLRLIASTYERERLHEQDPAQYEEVNKDYVIVGLDLLSGVVEGLGQSVESLVEGNPQMMSLLAVCMNDAVPEVRQSAFALLGDLSSSCFVHVRPHVNGYFVYLERNLVPTHVSTCNNAAWALGEIALQLGSDMDAFAQVALPILINILHMDRTALPLTLLENIAVAIGRLGKSSPAVVAPHLPVFLENWCRYVKVIRDNAEKESAFFGICSVVERNPNGAVGSFMFLCDAFASWTSPSADLAARIGALLSNFKASAGAQWATFFNNCPDTLARLEQFYRI